MKKIPLFLLFFFFLMFPTKSFALSEYVLPYPSAMPGGINYKVHVVLENILQYWYFGNLGQFTYNLKESDKYLVEAKTLFEYKQYLLGYKALILSDIYFNKIKPTLIKAQKEGKDTSKFYAIFRSAAEKHEEVLKTMMQDTPITFLWQPEKSTPTELNLHTAIDQAIRLRLSIL